MYLPLSYYSQPFGYFLVFCPAYIREMKEILPWMLKTISAQACELFFTLPFWDGHYWEFG
jgi:hypothetical protein